MPSATASTARAEKSSLLRKRVAADEHKKAPIMSVERVNQRLQLGITCRHLLFPAPERVSYELRLVPGCRATGLPGRSNRWAGSAPPANRNHRICGSFGPERGGPICIHLVPHWCQPMALRPYQMVHEARPAPSRRGGSWTRQSRSERRIARQRHDEALQLETNLLAEMPITRVEVDAIARLLGDDLPHRTHRRIHYRRSLQASSARHLARAAARAVSGRSKGCE